MGSLTIKNKALRCEKCFMLKKITIEPNYPQSTVCFECNCGFTRQSLTTYASILENEELFKVKCSFCGREPKHPTYCTGCRRTYCTSCKQAHDTTIQTKTPHKLIDSYKYDFYCSTHLDDIFCGYCKTCSLNICEECIKEKIHKGHRFIKYEKMLLSPKDEDNLKENLRVNTDKIEANVNKCKAIVSQLKNEETIKDLRNVCNVTVRENKAILNIIRYFYKLYTEMKLKNKNYVLIYNLVENIKFNPQIKFLESDGTIEKKTDDFLEYLKRDYVLFKRFNTKTRGSTTVSKPITNHLNKKVNRSLRSEDNKLDVIQEFQNEAIDKNTGERISDNSDNTNKQKPSTNMFNFLGVQKPKESPDLHTNININQLTEDKKDVKADNTNNENNKEVDNNKNDKNEKLNDDEKKNKESTKEEVEKKENIEDNNEKKNEIKNKDDITIQKDVDGDENNNDDKNKEEKDKDKKEEDKKNNDNDNIIIEEEEDKNENKEDENETKPDKKGIPKIDPKDKIDEVKKEDEKIALIKQKLNEELKKDDEKALLIKKELSEVKKEEEKPIIRRKEKEEKDEDEKEKEKSNNDEQQPEEKPKYKYVPITEKADLNLKKGALVMGMAQAFLKEKEEEPKPVEETEEEKLKKLEEKKKKEEEDKNRKDRTKKALQKALKKLHTKQKVFDLKSGHKSKDTSTSAPNPTDNPISTSNPTDNPITTPASNPISNPTDIPIIVPASNPISNPTDIPIIAPVSNPISNPTDIPITAPASNPISNPTDIPITAPASNPISNPSDNPITMPASKPISNPIDNPITTPVSKPISNPIDNPITTPASKPISNPIPSSTSTSTTTSKPISIPTSKPTPTSKPNPTSKPTPTSKQTSIPNPKANNDILNNPKFAMLAKMMKGRVPGAPKSRDNNNNNDQVKIEVDNEKPDEIIMNKPIIHKKKPKKVNFDGEILEDSDEDENSVEISDNNNHE